MLSGSRPAPGIEEFLDLRRRDHRDLTGRYVIEGARFVHAAIRTRTAIDGAVVCPDLLGSGSRCAVDALRGRGVPVRQIARPEFEAISMAGEASGVAAIVQRHWTPLRRPMACETPVWLALGHIRSPGNLGTLLRTAAAAGVRGVILMDDATDPFHPVTVRASMGAVMSVSLSRMTPAHLAAWKRRTGTVVVGSSSSAPCDFHRLPRRRPLAIVVGCERRGMSRAQRRICDLTVSIPMAAGVDSLNVAVAAGVLLFAARGTR